MPDGRLWLRSSGAGAGGGGKVSIYNAAGSTHVVVDVAGWYGG